MSKSIAKNAALNMGHKAVTVLFPLITSVYVSRTLGASGIGQVSSAQNMVTYFTMIASLGIPSYGVRAIAQTKSNTGECNRTFTELFIINLISTLFSFLCYIVFLVCLKKVVCPNALQIIFSSLILMNAFNIEWLYQGFEEYKYITIRSIIVKIISLVLMFLLVKTERDVYGYAIIVCFGTVGNYLLNITQLRKYVRFTNKSIDIKRHMKAILTFFASVIAVEVYTMLDITMLTYMCRPENVGYYSNASKIVKIIANTITAIGAVLLPRLSLYFGNQDEIKVKKLVSNFFDVITMFSLPCCIGIYITADELIPVLFGDSFLPAVATIRILCPMAVLLPLSGGIFAQILQTSGREKDYFVGVCTGAVINVILNAVLIGRLQENGAAFASVLTECCVNIVMLLFCRKVIRVKYISRDLMVSVLSCVALVISLELVKILIPVYSNILLLIIEITVGVLTYFGGLIIFGNSKLDIVMRRLHLR